jgi:hypothetical protein
MLFCNLIIFQYSSQEIKNAVSKFIVPCWWDKVDGTTFLCRSQLNPPARDYEFCYWTGLFYSDQYLHSTPHSDTVWVHKASFKQCKVFTLYLPTLHIQIEFSSNIDERDSATLMVVKGFKGHFNILY